MPGLIGPKGRFAGLEGPPWLRLRDYAGTAVLVVQAHADDADWNCGGTAAMLARAGAKVVYVMATDGSAGSKDPAMTRSRLARIREEEQREANAALGVEETIFLGYPDGQLGRAADLDARIAGIVRRYRPSLFMTFDPDWPEDEMHPDHRAVCLAGLRAVRFASLALAFTEENPVAPHECKEVLLFNPRHPNVWVPTGPAAHLKVRALQAHRSQMTHMLNPTVQGFMDWLVARGDTLDARLILGALHTRFLVEPFRRFPAMGMLR